MDSMVISKIKAIAAEIEPELIEFRRDLHMHPEVAGEEFRTAEKIAEALRRIPGMQVREHLSVGTGVVGELHGAKGDGKCVMLRADIDALPQDEMTDVPFKSTVLGKMHACGHDAHASWLLGAARILGEMRDEFAGTIKFVFQPSEERGGGAYDYIHKDNILENPHVDAAFAAHAWPFVEAGKIGIAAEYPFGCAGRFSVNFVGKGGHGSWPHKARNPITAAVQFCQAAADIAANKLDSTEPRVVSVCSLHAGKPGVSNIIPDTCLVEGTARATEQAILRQIGEELERAAEAVSMMHEIEHQSNIEMIGVPVHNDPELVGLVRSCAGEVVGDDNAYIINKKHLGGEDFALYSELVPSCYFFAGIADPDDETPDLHSQYFKLDEGVIATAAQTFALSAIEYLTNKMDR